MLPNWLYGKSLRKLQEILNSGGQTAAGVSYSNTESGLEATNAQDAIDEIAEDLDTKAAQSTVSTLSDTVTTLTETVNGKAALTQITNPNLLDNPWFTVNQRGFTSGAVTYGTYILDRWKISDNDSNITVSSGTNGLSIVGTPTNAGENLIYQAIEYDRIPNSVGKVITLSVMLADGTVYKSSHVLVNPTSSWQVQASVDCGTFQVHLLTEGTTPSTFQLFLKSTDEAINATIRALKLELGSVSTLAMDTAPNYATELLKCQRYFYRCKDYSGTNGYVNFAFGFGQSTQQARFQIVLPVVMASAPNISKSGAIAIETPEGTVVSSNLDTIVSTGWRGNVMNIGVNTSDSLLTANTPYQLRQVNDRDAYIDFSADL